MSDIEKADEFRAFCHEVVTNKTALTELDRLKSENAALKAELVKANADHWIPVSVSLPPIGRYQAFFRNGMIESLTRTSEYMCPFVTHWRELPTPPKV